MKQGPKLKFPLKEQNDFNVLNSNKNVIKQGTNAIFFKSIHWCAVVFLPDFCQNLSVKHHK